MQCASTNSVGAPGIGAGACLIEDIEIDATSCPIDDPEIGASAAGVKTPVCNTARENRQNIRKAFDLVTYPEDKVL